MLNEERVRLMVKLASYECAQGDMDFKISSYNRKDYTSFNTIITLIWSTIGYILVVALVGVIFMEKLLNHMTLTVCITLGISVVGGYVLLLIISGIVAGSFYHKTYNQSKQRVKKYYRELVKLNRMYDKEKL